MVNSTQGCPMHGGLYGSNTLATNIFWALLGVLLIIFIISGIYFITQKKRIK